MCTACPEGTFQTASGSGACLECGVGFLCAEGSSVRLPASCDAGTYLAEGVTFNSKNDCSDCPPGKACYGGSASPKACTPGTFASGWRAQECASCEAGTFQPLRLATACQYCNRGYYCEEGAPLQLPCPSGTHMNASLLVMTSVEQCVICPKGTFCSVGTDAATPCAPGTFNAHASATTCSRCPAGAYQAAEGATSCTPCTNGYYCEEGLSLIHI